MYFSKKIIIYCFFSCFCISVIAQEDDYRGEIGILGGISYYLGDANKTLFKNLEPAYGGLFRYRFDTRFAARAEFTRTKIKGEIYPLEFTNSVNALDLCGEFNFFDLEKSKHKRFSKIYSPYIFTGIGFMNYSYEEKQNLGVSIPFGVGIKFKIANRLNLNLQFSNRLLLKDNLEGKKELNNSYKLNGSNFLNNDLLSTLTIGITYDIWKKECDCITF